ncbi:MAG: hypothetical protein ACJA0N_002576, partial [Pseudohongiellaceae bacterium]
MVVIKCFFVFFILCDLVLAGQYDDEIRLRVLMLEKQCVSISSELSLLHKDIPVRCREQSPIKSIAGDSRVDRERYLKAIAAMNNGQLGVSRSMAGRISSGSIYNYYFSYNLASYYARRKEWSEAIKFYSALEALDESTAENRALKSRASTAKAYAQSSDGAALQA